MEAAPSHLLGPGMHKKKKVSWALTLTSLCVLTVNTLWPTASGSCHMTFSLLWLGPWAVNQSKHFCSQVALVRNIVTVLRGAANSTLCLLFTFPWEWFFFFKCKEVFDNPCARRNPQCLRFSRLSVAFHDRLWSPEVWPVKICLTCSGLQPYQINHLFCAFSSVHWHIMSSLSREVPPFASFWALLSIPVV